MSMKSISKESLKTASDFKELEKSYSFFSEDFTTIYCFKSQEDYEAFLRKSVADSISAHSAD